LYAEDSALFNQKVVFIVGAGASREYSFPLGSELKDRIAADVRFRFEHGSWHLVAGSVDLFEHIRRHAKGANDRTNDYTLASNELANAIPSFVSIDEALHFVSGTPEAVEVGKIAIVHHILKAERESSLTLDAGKGRLVNLPDGWIGDMFSMAVAGSRREDLVRAFDNVTFVNFNYDRAIEQYLYWALQQRASVPADDARSIVAGLNMLRPYGSIGQFAPSPSDQFAFGTTQYFDPFSRLSQLGTYTDQKPMHDVASMQSAIGAAKLVVFLGFGFHPSNVDLIKIGSGNGIGFVLGTVKGIHHSNHQLIKERIARNLQMSPGGVDLHDMTASELLRELRPRILMLAS
jgi:hypothetical protein